MTKLPSKRQGAVIEAQERKILIYIKYSVIFFSFNYKYTYFSLFKKSTILILILA